jgi:hypothetical protein
MDYVQHKNETTFHISLQDTYINKIHLFHTFTADDCGPFYR